MPTTLTVTQVNTYIKSLLDEIPQIKNIYITGEISNFKYYRQSGHMYFTLKDAVSQLKCVMFASDNCSLKFMPENGMDVICFGQISVYERDGVYQLYVHGMHPRGIGSLQIAYEQLKAKLEAEGLFDELHKKCIPRYPSKIGVATSNMGAAVEDIKNIISRRFPLAEIVIVPTVVQGECASADIVHSIQLLDNMNVDTIIVGRGGGSIEDLWAFNTEQVARAVFQCKTPVISAVGHETDFTICDFVADMRAPTPSAAAELAVPDMHNEFVNIDHISGTLDMLISRKIEIEENRMKNFTRNSVLSGIDDFFALQMDKVNSFYKDMLRGIKYQLEMRENTISRYASTLNALSPLEVLGRGYSITRLDNEVLSSVNRVKKDDIININLRDGSMKAAVCEVIHNER